MQQTIGEVLPAVQQHQTMVGGDCLSIRPATYTARLPCLTLVPVRARPAFPNLSNQLKQLLDTVSAQLSAKEKEAVAWKVKYKIQTQQERELARHQATEQAAAGAASGGGKQQGVLA